MLTILLTFLMTTLAWLVLLGFGLRRLAFHLKGNEAAMQAVTQHVLLPLIGKTPVEPEEEHPPIELFKPAPTDVEPALAVAKKVVSIGK